MTEKDDREKKTEPEDEDLPEDFSTERQVAHYPKPEDDAKIIVTRRPTRVPRRKRKAPIKRTKTKSTSVKITNKRGRRRMRR